MGAVPCDGPHCLLLPAPPCCSLLLPAAACGSRPLRHATPRSFPTLPPAPAPSLLPPRWPPQLACWPLPRCFGRHVSDTWAKFSGYLLAPATATYTFFLSSSDGSRLFLGGALAVSNGGVHKLQQRSGKVLLEAGWHPLVLECFQHDASGGVELEWEAPGSARRIVRRRTSAARPRCRREWPAPPPPSPATPRLWEDPSHRRQAPRRLPACHRPRRHPRPRLRRRHPPRHRLPAPRRPASPRCHRRRRPAPPHHPARRLPHRWAPRPASQAASSRARSARCAPWGTAAPAVPPSPSPAPWDTTPTSRAGPPATPAPSTPLHTSPPPPPASPATLESQRWWRARTTASGPGEAVGGGGGGGEVRCQRCDCCKHILPAAKAQAPACLSEPHSRVTHPHARIARVLRAPQEHAQRAGAARGGARLGTLPPVQLRLPCAALRCPPASASAAPPLSLPPLQYYHIHSHCHPHHTPPPPPLHTHHTPPSIPPQATARAR